MKSIALIVCAAACFAATPAEVAIKQAAANIEKQPAHYPHYNDLAMAYARRARETANAQFYEKAGEALRKSFAIAPDNRELMTFATPTGERANRIWELPETFEQLVTRRQRPQLDRNPQ